MNEGLLISFISSFCSSFLSRTLTTTVGPILNSTHGYYTIQIPPPHIYNVVVGIAGDRLLNFPPNGMTCAIKRLRGNQTAKHSLFGSLPKKCLGGCDTWGALVRKYRLSLLSVGKVLRHILQRSEAIRRALFCT